MKVHNGGRLYYTEGWGFRQSLYGQREENAGEKVDASRLFALYFRKAWKGTVL